MAKAAVFFDKDGTLVRDFPYNVDPSRLVFYPEAAFAVSSLDSAGFDLFVISNQPGLAFGKFKEFDLIRIRREMNNWFHRHGSSICDFLYCPHHPEGVVERFTKVCYCRKPRPGLILRAALAGGIDLAKSWFIGDILDDMEAGRAAGCKTILIDNGNETDWALSPARLPHYIARDLNEAARVITARADLRPAAASLLEALKEA